MGSGAVGVEFASIFRRFGSDVTIIELLPRLVPVEDEAVSAELEKSFKKQGIKVLTGTQGDERASAAPTASTSRRRLADGKTQKLERRVPARRDRTRAGDDRARRRGRRASHSSAATSRSTRLFRTNVPGISAIGDVITFGEPGHPQLAHVSSAEGIVAGRADRRTGVRGRSTTTRCPAAPTAIPKSAASA